MQLVNKHPLINLHFQNVVARLFSLKQLLISFPNIKNFKDPVVVFSSKKLKSPAFSPEQKLYLLPYSNNNIEAFELKELNLEKIVVIPFEENNFLAVDLSGFWVTEKKDNEGLDILMQIK